VLVGRDRELRRVTTLLDEARRGRSGALLVTGEPGVGKTALLEEARSHAADMRVLAATGVESESELPFSSLHQLLRPALELLPRIPAAQAHALSAALALEEGEPDALSVGAGTLSLLVEAAESSPLLVVLDDAHWLDQASAEALGFASRRLAGEDLAFLGAKRPEHATVLDSFPRLELGPLDVEDARLLLRQRQTPVGGSDERRLLEAAAGNPLALLELPVELTHDLPAASSSYERLERAFSRRMDGLPPGGRLGLLLAAAEPDVGTVRRAADSLGVDDPLGPAEAAGLIRIHERSLAFRHPVVRSLAYAKAAAADRTIAHRALAGALDDEADSDRRAWHLAAAADAPDETIASLLEQTAGRATARGGVAAAARALELSAHLSPQRADRARRLFAAFNAHRHSGDSAKARVLGNAALAIADDPLLRADLLFRLRAHGEWTGDRASELELLRDSEAEGLDDERRGKLIMLAVNQRGTEWDAAGAAELASRLERFAEGAGAEWAARFRGQAAIAYLTAGERDRARRLFEGLESDPTMPVKAAFEYMSLELDDTLRSSLAETLRQERAAGNLHRIAWSLTGAAHLELRHGRLTAAEAAAAEAIGLGEILANPKMDLAAAALAAAQAWRGQAEGCVANARRAAASARVARDRFAEGLALEALALLALGEGRPAAAVAELEPLAQAWLESSVGDPAVVRFVPDLVEAYALSGAASEARALLDRFERVADAAGSTWSLAASARCLGILADAESFDEPFRRALELLEPSPLVLELARTRLAYGERLRRQGRRRDARDQLRLAHEAFAAASAEPWRARSAAELRATGEQVAAEPGQRPELTPQEVHIATLVAEGKTNKEIAAGLYLSTKTIEYHLANTYRKLNIHSRVELARIVSRDWGTTPSPDLVPARS
jgi:DNA-binding CsgD family transcriptional regulator